LKRLAILGSPSGTGGRELIEFIVLNFSFKDGGGGRTKAVQGRKNIWMTHFEWRVLEGKGLQADQQSFGHERSQKNTKREPETV
jgi:hypothetical protein